MAQNAGCSISSICGKQFLHHTLLLQLSAFGTMSIPIMTHTPLLG